MRREYDIVASRPVVRQHAGVSSVEQEVQFQIDLAAAEYLTVLARLHALLRPKTYLEIGTRSGDSLKLAQCASVAVDPAFSISADTIGAKPSCHFYQTTSDRFFERCCITETLGGAVELAYLDGMHLAEFLLRDFTNVEHVCKRNSVVVIHDCMPSDVYMTCRYEGDEAARSRSCYPDWWTGDVWKTVWALKQYRPDLKITAIDSPPTGLICVTNLDPGSHVLEKQYASIVTEMTALGESNKALQDYLASLSPISPSEIATFEQISEYFYM